MKKTILVLLFAAACVLAAASANAKCTWVTAPPTVLFGTYSAFGGVVSTNVGYAINCTPNDSAIITFTTGANSSSYFPRYMRNGTELLQYNLYDNAANTIVLGDGSGGTTTRVTFNGEPRNKDFADVIYASIPGGADVAPGVYTDTVTAILDSGGITTRTFTVMVTVPAECTVSTTPVVFGNYDPIGTHATTALDSTGTVEVYCTRGTNVTVSLGTGLSPAAPSRRMQGPGGSLLTYNLFTTAARTVVWDTTNMQAGTSTSRLLPISGGMTVFGRVTAGQDPAVGAYTDTVQATVNY